MKLEEQEIIALIKSANPIAETDALLESPVESRAFLRAVDLRRNDMSERTVTELERKPEPPKQWRRRGPVIAVAVLVIVVAIGIGFAVLSGGESESDVAGTPVPTVVPTTAPQPTTPVETQPPSTTAAAAEALTITTDEALAVVEEFLDLQSNGQMVASLDLATAEVANRERDFYGGIEVWNNRSEQTEPCQEISPLDTGIELLSRFRCVRLDYDDFHAAGGLSPFEENITFTVNEAGVISNISVSLVEFQTISTFNERFMRWLTEAHPEQAAQMSLPPSDNFNSEDARIALQYVDEFVAQSDEYPVEAASNP